MSMQRMRENTKTILWVVVISFVITIFAVWGMDLRTGSSQQDPNVIGRVNGTPISRLQYQQLVDQMLKSMSQNNPNAEVTYAQRRMVEDQAWNSLLYNILMRQEIEKLAITVTEEEVAAYLRSSPPPEIQQYFVDEKGDFDYQAYQAALNNPEIDWSNLKELARSRLPLEKLQNYLQSMVHVSEAEVRRAYEEENAELSAAYVEIPFSNIDVDDYQPTPDEVESYYEEHNDLFSEPAKARIVVAAVDIAPASRDIVSARETIELVKEQLAEGVEFAELAKTYSQSPTAMSDGETSFIRTGARDQAVLEAAGKLSKGEVSDPIETENGFYIVKLLDSRRASDGVEEYKLQEVFVRIEAGYETLDSLRTLMSQVRDDASEVGLEKAAEKYGLEPIRPEPFYEGYPISGLGFIPDLGKFAFSAEPGDISALVRDDRRFYVASLLERIPPSVKPLSDVEEGIRKELVRAKRRELGREKATGFYKAARDGDFEGAASRMGLEVIAVENFHVSDNLEKFGTYSKFATAAFSIGEGSITPPVEMGGSFYVIKLLKREPFDEEDYREKMEDIGNRLYQQKVQEFLGYWYERLEKASKIDDYRNRF